MSRTSAIIVPTCDRDKWFSEIAIRGIRKHIPSALVVEFKDTDTKTERKVPGDIRELCRKIPYLRKQVDAPFVIDVDDIIILDADAFVCRRPDELLSGYGYQGHTLYGTPDYPWGLQVWAELGFKFPVVRPLFCAGVFSAPRSMWTLNETMIFEYLRQCVKHGFHDPNWKYSNVTLDQNLAAGLWRKTCKDNPLSALEYPLGIPTVDQKVFHACYYKKRREFMQFLAEYARELES